MKRAELKAGEDNPGRIAEELVSQFESDEWSFES